MKSVSLKNEERSIIAFSPSMKTISRIMKVLLQKRSIGRTNLSLETNLHYGRLSQHIDWLEKKSFIKLIVQDKKINLVLTDKGMQFALMLTDIE